MNSNTFVSLSASYPSSNPFSLPAAAATTSVTETAFVNGPNSTQAYVKVPVGTEILGSQTPFDPNANNSKIFGSGRSAGWMGETAPYFNAKSFDGRPFRLRASGYIAGGGTTLTSVSASINIYAVLTQVTTVTSGTKVASLGITGGIGNASAHWMTDVIFMWDSTSLVLSGVQGPSAFGAVTTLAGGGALTTVGSVALTSLTFGLSYVFATSSTANTVGLVELSLEQV